MTSVEKSYFLNIYYHTKFLDRTLSNASVSDIQNIAMLVLLMAEILRTL
jgi:hypothetical protein